MLYTSALHQLFCFSSLFNSPKKNFKGKQFFRNKTDSLLNNPKISQDNLLENCFALPHSE